MLDQVKSFFMSLQDQICEQLSAIDSSEFEQDQWVREEGGGGRSRVIKNGNVFEQAGVNFSHVFGANMPASATAHRPELQGRSFNACGVSLVIHPHNPYIPTTHMNVRFFIAEKEGADPVWWFGGGYDLTPFYPFEQDIKHWHQTAKDVCDQYGEAVYPKYKKWCDEYFYLKHRDETRGIGGIFYDDLNELGFEPCFEFTQKIGRSFCEAYIPIVNRCKDMEFGDRQRQFQLYRRGRYVEFNLVFDRGTLFGLQTGGRTESILMSMPPLARWEYQYTPEAGSEEAKLYDVLKPIEWL